MPMAPSLHFSTWCRTMEHFRLWVLHVPQPSDPRTLRTSEPLFLTHDSSMLLISATSRLSRHQKPTLLSEVSLCHPCSTEEDYHLFSLCNHLECSLKLRSTRNRVNNSESRWISRPIFIPRSWIESFSPGFTSISRKECTFSWSNRSTSSTCSLRISTVHRSEE